MLNGYYYCLNCHSEITPDYNEHCCFCGSAAVAVSGDYSPEEVETAFDLLNKQQQGIVAEVRHGEWVNGVTGYTCSVCDKQEPTKRFLYCPNCGAKMDGKGD